MKPCSRALRLKNSGMRNDETLVEMDMYEAVLESITPEELRDEFRHCFDTDRYMILSIGPFQEND